MAQQSESVDRFCPDCRAVKLEGRETHCRRCEKAAHRRSGHADPPYPERKPSMPWFCDRRVIPSRYAPATLSDLPKGLVSAYESLPADRGLYLWGPPGAGKTHAMAAFLWDRWYHGFDVDRVQWELLCLKIRETYGRHKYTEIDVLDPFLSTDVLVLEDVGVTVSDGQIESDFSLRMLLLILDHRLENMKPTFLTSNKGIESIAKSFDQRIGSRLHQACEIIRLDGPDRRKASAR
jgi:hypothetical protein